MKKNDTKTKIIQKSINLYNNKGFNVTTKNIIQNANVSNGSFFHFFDKKETLVSDMFNFIKEEFIDNVNIEYNENQDFIIRIEQLFNDLVQWGTKNHDYFMFLLKFKNNPNFENQEEANILFYTLNKFIEIGIIKNYFKKIDSILLTSIAVSTLSHIIFYLNENPNEDFNKYFVLFLDFIKINPNNNIEEEPEDLEFV